MSWLILSGAIVFEVMATLSLRASQGLKKKKWIAPIAVLYLSLLPQFISPERGNVLGQSLVLGGVQVMTSVSVNAMIAVSAGTIAGFLSGRPTWLVIQRWFMGTVLAGLAIRMATEARR